MFDIQGHYSRWIREARPGGYYLYELSASSAPGPQIAVPVPGRGAGPLINLASYNYLGLAQEPRVIEAAAAALRRYGLGAAGSPYLSGALEVHDELATKLARFKGVDATLLFPTGYAANVGTIAALVGPGDVVLADRAAHVSIVDGAVLSRAKLMFFRHNSPGNLALKLAGIPPEVRVLVAVEGVYSMDGDVAPLVEFAELCRARPNTRLLVDEAHSAFVYGDHGRGLVEALGVEDQVDVQIGTLSKSLGGMGGYVGGAAELIDYLRPYARSQVFSCALAPAVAGGLVAALDLAAAEPERRTRLWANVARMRAALERHGVDTGESSSQIIPIMINDDLKVFRVTERLLEAGVYLNPIRYPAVKRGRARLRVSISAAHAPDVLDLAADRIAEILRDEGVLT